MKTFSLFLVLLAASVSALAQPRYYNGGYGYPPPPPQRVVYYRSAPTPPMMMGGGMGQDPISGIIASFSRGRQEKAMKKQQLIDQQRREALAAKQRQLNTTLLLRRQVNSECFASLRRGCTPDEITRIVAGIQQTTGSGMGPNPSQSNLSKPTTMPRVRARSY